MVVVRSPAYRSPEPEAERRRAGLDRAALDVGAAPGRPGEYGNSVPFFVLSPSAIRAN